MSNPQWVPTRRPTALGSKPVFSVEEWESKAPLNARETRSVHHLKQVCERRNLPLKFSTEPPRSSTPPRTFKRDIVAPHTRSPSPAPVPPLASKSSLHPLHPTHPIQSPQQFHDWFALIERSIQHSQEAHFRAHLSLVASHLDTCGDLILDSQYVETEVESMLQGWRLVEEGGRSLQGASERLLEERDRLLQVTEAIATRLEYFQELEHATRMLNHPGDSLVLQADFLLMVERVDVCLEFLQLHRHYREAEIYILRFQQCLTRAMTLIKMFFVGSLKAITADVQKRLSEKDVSPTAQMHLLYSRFSSISAQLGPLLAELERRARAHPEELDSLLTECHVSYFAARKSLLASRLAEDIKGLDPSRSDLVDLTRSGCSYLKQLCIDEFNLYRNFFNSGQDRLYRYLENLCDYLYDDLRPRILHEPRLTVLCQVCTVLQALMVLDADVPHSATPDDDDELSPTIGSSGTDTRGLDRLHISHLLQMVLQDAQTRLFFKAQALVQSDIRYYVPTPEDLSYPEKLISNRSGAESGAQETWYPTLQKTQWVLSQLRNLVKAEIFHDIAQEAVGLCRQSLSSASELILAKDDAPSAVDADLFLVRHLLILKDLTSNLDLGNKDHSNEFGLGGVTESLGSLLRGTSYLLAQTTFFASLGMSRSSEPVPDIKIDIDRDLKQACEKLISQGENSATLPLRAFLESVAPALTTSQNTSPQPLPSLSFATPDIVIKVNTEFQETCEREVKAWVARLKLYLEDIKTVSVLIAPLQAKIIDRYAEMRDIVQAHYSDDVFDTLLSHHTLSDLITTWTKLSE